MLCGCVCVWKPPGGGGGWLRFEGLLATFTTRHFYTTHDNRDLIQSPQASKQYASKSVGMHFLLLLVVQEV